MEHWADSISDSAGWTNLLCSESKKEIVVPVTPSPPSSPTGEAEQKNKIENLCGGLALQEHEHQGPLQGVAQPKDDSSPSLPTKRNETVTDHNSRLNSTLMTKHAENLNNSVNKCNELLKTLRTELLAVVVCSKDTIDNNKSALKLFAMFCADFILANKSSFPASVLYAEMFINGNTHNKIDQIVFLKQLIFRDSPSRSNLQPEQDNRLIYFLSEFTTC